MTFASPVNPEKSDRVLRLLDLSPGRRFLDIGCGDGELVVRAQELSGCSGVGIDKDPEAIRRAAALVAARVPGADITFRTLDASEFVTDRPFDAAACVGASHAYGGYRATLRALAGLVRPGGCVLVGDLYWKCEPDEEYLAVLGETRDAHLDHRGNVLAGAEDGLTPLYTAVSSDDDWDDFEGRFWCGRLKADPAAPPSPGLLERRQRALRWQDAYLRWGRKTLGFGLYLFQT